MAARVLSLSPFTAHVGSRSKLSGLPTYQALTKLGLARLVAASQRYETAVAPSRKESRLAMKALLFVGMITCLAVVGNATHQQTGIEPGNGLGMSVAPDEAATGPDKAMHFKVTFSNLRSEDLTLIPGTLIACGMAPSKTSAVKLNLTEPQGKQHRHLPYLGDGPPYQLACAGQIELYVVVLHRGESLSLPLDIGKYVDLSDSKQYDGARFPAGNYSLQAELTTEPSDNPKSILKTKNVWMGRAISNTVPIHFASEFLALLDDYPR